MNKLEKDFLYAVKEYTNLRGNKNVTFEIDNADEGHELVEKYMNTIEYWEFTDNSQKYFLSIVLNDDADLNSSLQLLYKGWRETQKEYDCNTDCGEASVREDFENYVRAETDITFKTTFEEMLKLENEF